ncbi:tetratricopeptide repeat protein 33 [Iris pallida]|uniref:Tetratricopeptide repeat protein 33 n=1 Tax=Iris pallida TaxID=29817 RepID=A0AAX6EST2_IRIPA|nr:tetratricopeptide repeat protein 33 [Iris pallida]
MKIVWKRKKNAADETSPNPNPNLPFFERVKEELIGEDEKNGVGGEDPPPDSGDHDQEKKLAETLESEGVRLAEGGLYNEALRKWEAAILLTPEKAKLHEQKAQVLLEIGDAWSSLKAAARATELDPLWAEAWITLGRAQLNYGEPDIAMESFDKALAIKPNHEEALIDRETASHLVKRRKQSHSTINSRYEIRDK